MSDSQRARSIHPVEDEYHDPPFLTRREWTDFRQYEWNPLNTWIGSIDKRLWWMLGVQIVLLGGVLAELVRR